MTKKHKEKPLASVIVENNPVELSLLRLLKRAKKEQKDEK